MPAITTALPPPLQRLTARVADDSTALPPLRATKPFDAGLASEIEAFALQVSPDRRCVGAALHLLNDDIDRAHKIAQDDEGDPTSNLCHAILHRREGDYWNSKWWYRQFEHPLIDDVYGGTAAAQTFVDAVEAIVGGKSGRGGASTACAAANLNQLKRKQADELAALIKYALSQHANVR